MGRLTDRGTRGTGRRERTRGARLLTLALGTALALTVGIAGAAPAGAADASATQDYPSWADVQKAKADEAAAKKLIARIKADIASLQVELEKTQAESKRLGDIYAAAQQAFDDAAYRADQLTRQADAAQKQADAAKTDAARSIAELGRSGAGDLTATLLSQTGGAADNLLYRLGAATKIGERSAEVYQRALQLQNTAQALTDQAKVASDQLAGLKKTAEDAYQKAQAAADAVASKLQQQQDDQDRLQAQLAVLTEKRQITQADYNAGVRAAYEAGQLSPDGWALPAVGCITSPFGMRYHPIYHIWRLHSGVDIGAGYDSPIHAAHAGRVIYAGWFSDLGYYIRIDHGGGIVSGYGHIRAGGILVHVGQWVDGGQVIAKVGSTGGSTGPHLHFMMYKNWVLMDPVPYMRDHGITIGC